MKKTAILLLAAGSANRMKKTKQLLPYKNTTLLNWAIQQAFQTKVSAVFCVLGANKNNIEKEITPNTVQVIYNPNYKNGLSSSISVGIQHLQKLNFTNVLIMLADQPTVTSNFLNKLLEASKKNTTKIIATEYKKNLGVPAVFPKSYFNELLGLKGDKGAKVILLQQQNSVIKITPEQPIIDIDTNEDYQALISED